MIAFDRSEERVGILRERMRNWGCLDEEEGERDDERKVKVIHGDFLATNPLDYVIYLIVMYI